MHGIRAVLIESTDMHWAHNLWEAAGHPIFSPLETVSTILADNQRSIDRPVVADSRTLPVYLEQPEPIWANPVEDKFWSLID